MSRRQSIRQKCLDCSGYENAEVSNCQITDCPLYPYRSGAGKQNAKDRDKAIRAYCMYCMNDQPGEVALCTSPFCPLFLYRGYNRDKKPSVAEKTAYRGFREHDLSEVESEYTPAENTLPDTLYTPSFDNTSHSYATQSGRQSVGCLEVSEEGLSPPQ